MKYHTNVLFVLYMSLCFMVGCGTVNKEIKNADQSVTKIEEVVTSSFEIQTDGNNDDKSREMGETSKSCGYVRYMQFAESDKPSPDYEIPEELKQKLEETLKNGYIMYLELSPHQEVYRSLYLLGRESR